MRDHVSPELIHEPLTLRAPVKVEPQGNNLPQAVKIMICAVRNGWVCILRASNYPFVLFLDYVLRPIHLSNISYSSTLAWKREY